ncbi:hypothetical protein DUU53_26265 [Salmonella enterica subsp. enterica serovar Berlin]|nr:hypothetical protein [Salmonella enterica subsp. enterica serovar Berlin]
MSDGESEIVFIFLMYFVGNDENNNEVFTFLLSYFLTFLLSYFLTFLLSYFLTFMVVFLSNIGRACYALTSLKFLAYY